MPELPEVEVVKNQISEIIKNQPRILRFEFFRKDLRSPIPIAKLKKIVGEKIVSIERRAKYLLFATETGGFLSHLGMTGTWRSRDGDEKVLHDHIYIFLDNGKCLAYRDPRRFGVFDVWSEVAGNKKWLSHLGPEPLSEAFSFDWLKDKTRQKNLPIKALIMDQKIVVGVGNIYASEALFLAGIRPKKKAGKLSDREITVLLSAIQSVLRQAIQKGGSSISDYYSFTGNKGNFQTEHNVYDRKGLKCTKCNNIIRGEVISGRSTFWCPVCQK